MLPSNWSYYIEHEIWAGHNAAPGEQVRICDWYANWVQKDCNTRPRADRAVTPVVAAAATEARVALDAVVAFQVRDITYQLTRKGLESLVAHDGKGEKRDEKSKRQELQ